MKVQAALVKSRIGPSIEEQKQSVVKEDFLSILKERSIGSGKRVKNEKTPVREAEKREETSRKKDVEFPEKAGEAGGQLAREGLNDSAVKLEESKPDDVKAEGRRPVGSEETQGKPENILTEAVPVYQSLAFGFPCIAEGGVQNIADGPAKAGMAGLLKMGSGISETASSDSAGESRIETQASALFGLAMAECQSAQTQQEIQAAAQPFPHVLKSRADGTRQDPNRAGRPQTEELLQAEPVKVFEAGEKNLQSGADGSGPNARETAGWFSLDHAVKGESAVKGPESQEQRKTQTDFSLEELQKKAQQNDFLTFERMIGAKLSGGSAVSAAGSRGIIDEAPIPEQLRAGIEQGIAKQLNQFTIRLKPEGLGEILVHMTSSGGKIALSIGVTNQETQKLLSSEMMHLKETLEPLHAEVQEIYHNSQGGMEMMNYDQGFFQNQQRNMAGTVRRHPVRTVDEEEETAEELRIEELAGRTAGYGRLSAYI